MSKVDEVFSESVARLQAWLQFLERKEAEYQTQLSRVRRSGGQQPTQAPTPEAVPVPADVPEAVPAVEPGAAQASKPAVEQEDPWL